MVTDYKTLYEQIKASIKDHLVDADALPPNSELPKLAGEITQVVFAELNRSGLTEDAFNSRWTREVPQFDSRGKS
ncbi:MAG: hypothetical protein QOJ64_2370 [Acidobacteriota bacterium]|nr:hypothetical protein [Acidobacteriota bacterium]